MNVFRSKIGSEILVEDEALPVDNHFGDYILEDIMDGNETTTS
jgi:hypothetical protein